MVLEHSTPETMTGAVVNSVYSYDEEEVGHTELVSKALSLMARCKSLARFIDISMTAIRTASTSTTMFKPHSATFPLIRVARLTKVGKLKALG